jgi:hypothetical protein
MRSLIYLCLFLLNLALVVFACQTDDVVGVLISLAIALYSFVAMIVYRIFERYSDK